MVQYPFARWFLDHSLVIAVILSFLVTSVIVTGCGHQRVLMVRSEPAEAEVCIKGKYKSQYFPTNKKTCVGMTPFEADAVEFVDEQGEKHEVSFADLESDKENFYILISRPGYGSRSMQVPSWEHFVALQPEGNAQFSNIAANPVVPAASAIPATEGQLPAEGAAQGNRAPASEPVATQVED